MPRGNLALWTELFGLWTAHLMPPLNPVNRHCEASLLADGN